MWCATSGCACSGTSRPCRSAFFQRTRSGQTVARLITDADQVKTAVSAALASLIQNCVMIVVYLAIMFGLSPRLTFVALAFAPVLLFVIRPLVRRLRRRSREVAAERGELTAHVSEMVSSVKLMRAYTAEAYETGRFQALASRFRKRVLRAQRFSSLTSPVSEVFGGMMIVAILWYGTLLALQATRGLGPEELITFLIVALRLNSPIKSISNYPGIMAGAVAGRGPGVRGARSPFRGNGPSGRDPGALRRSNRVPGGVVLLRP